MVKLWTINIWNWAVLYVYSITQKSLPWLLIIGLNSEIAVLQLYPVSEGFHGEYGQKCLWKHSIVSTSKVQKSLPWNSMYQWVQIQKGVVMHLRCWDCSSVRLVRWKCLKHCAVSTLTDPWNFKGKLFCTLLCTYNGVCEDISAIPHEILLIQGKVVKLLFSLFQANNHNYGKSLLSIE